MRKLLLTAVFVALPWMYTAEPTGILGAPATAVAADEAPKAPDAPAVDVNINKTERHVFSFANPTVLAVALGGLVILVALIAMARGGGTTIVREK